MILFACRHSTTYMADAASVYQITCTQKTDFLASFIYLIPSSVPFAIQHVSSQAAPVVTSCTNVQCSEPHQCLQCIWYILFCLKWAEGCIKRLDELLNARIIQGRWRIWSVIPMCPLHVAAPNFEPTTLHASPAMHSCLTSKDILQAESSLVKKDCQQKMHSPMAAVSNDLQICPSGQMPSFCAAAQAFPSCKGKLPVCTCWYLASKAIAIRRNVAAVSLARVVANTVKPAEV